MDPHSGLRLRLQVVCKLPDSIRPTFTFYILHSTFYISRFRIQEIGHLA